MSEMFSDVYTDDVDANGNPVTQTPEASGLRQFAEKTQAENKELRERIAHFEAKERQDALSQALDSAGKDPAAVALIPVGVVDADGVNQWLEEHGQLIRDKQTTVEPPETQIQQTPEQPQSISDQEAQQLAAVSGAPEGPSPTGASNDVLAQLAQAKSKEEYWEIMGRAQSQGLI